MQAFDAPIEPHEGLGQLPANIVHFCRGLRKAGLKLGPQSVVDAITAVTVAGVESRDVFYWALHTVLVKKREDHTVFEAAFPLFWRHHAGMDDLLSQLEKGDTERPETQEYPAGHSRAAEAFSPFIGGLNTTAPEVQWDIEARLVPSDQEILRGKDFAQMSASELVAAKAAIAKMQLSDDALMSRRWRNATRNSQRGGVDPAETLRKAVRSNGDLILPQWRQKRIYAPPIVVIADISGSMSQYSRIFLHFMHSLRAQSVRKKRRVHSFVFGTQLTNLTPVLDHRDPDEALASAARRVKDWSGGTRIGAVLEEFNRTWSRRVLGQGATVLLITDGLERDDPEQLSRQMERLQKSSRHLIWLNPLLRFDGFEPRAAGVRAMMPHVDAFRPVHSLNALNDLCDALSKGR